MPRKIPHKTARLGGSPTIIFSPEKSFMDIFLRMHPEYSERAELLGKIQNKTLYEYLGTIGDHCNVLDIDGLKELLNEGEPENKKEIRGILRRVSNKEPEGVEKMVYRVLTHRPVIFDNIMTKIMFYREFWGLRRYFRNGTSDHFYVMAELLYLRVYRHKEVSSHVLRKILELSFLDKVFYFMNFSGLIKTDTVTDIIRDIGSGGVGDPRVDYKLIAISCLPSESRYKLLSAHILYSAPVEKLKLITGLDMEKLAMAMLNECFSSSLGINGFYLDYLHIIQMLSLSREFKVKLLYSWMRYFLVNRMTEQFKILFERMKATEQKGEEFYLYELFNEHLNGRLDFGAVTEYSKKFKDENPCALHSIDQLVDAYAHR